MESGEGSPTPALERVASPHVKAAVDSFNKSPFYTEQRSTDMTRLMNDMWDLQVEGTQLFTTEDGRISTPYTRIDITKYAETLLGQDFSQLPSDETRPENKQLISFPSVLAPENGHITSFIEPVFHRYVVALTGILADVKRGVRPQNVSALTLGAPTVLFGKVDQKFVADLKTEGIKPWARVYSQLVEQNLPKTPEEKAKTQITFHGISMGGSFAAATAEDLVLRKVVSQHNKEKGKPVTDDLPNLVVLMEAPTGLHTGGRQNLRIKLGFGIGTAISFLRDSYQRRATFTERQLTKDLIPVFANKGIGVNMSPDQEKLKKQAIGTVVEELVKGIPVGSEVRAHTMRGRYDLTAVDWRSLFKRRAPNEDETLGRNLLPPGAPNLQEFEIDSTHARKYFYSGEFQKWAKLSDMLSATKTQQQPIAA